MKRLRTILLLVAFSGLAIALTTTPSSAALGRRKPRRPVLIPIPRKIPRADFFPDPSGNLSTFQPAGATRTARNPFFQTLGADPRTCVACHQIDHGFALSAQAVQTRFTQSEGTDPLFNPIDAATCPSDDVSSPTAQEAAYKLILNYALVRIGLPIPLPPQRGFEVTAVNDPYGCTSLTSPTSGTLSVYRRVLPTTNLAFATTLMWDGRETSQAQAALDEALVHEEAASPGPDAVQQNQIVDFETGIFTAQISDHDAGSLQAKPTTLALSVPSGGSGPCAQATVRQTGGAEALAALAREFFLGINDPEGQNPCGTAFNDDVFDLYDAWGGIRGGRGGGARGGGGRRRTRESIVRGQQLFNTRQFDISSIGGLNKVVGQAAPPPGTCSFCHDAPNVGNESAGVLFATGTSDPTPVGVTNIPELPVFTLQCTDTNSPLFGQTLTVTDPGAALVTGACEDIGKMKVPALRGLAARAPYFHNGIAASLSDVVDFYDARFNIGLSDQDKQDLVNFLEAL